MLATEIDRVNNLDPVGTHPMPPASSTPPENPTEFSDSKVVAEIENLNSLLADARTEIGRVIFGQSSVIEEAIIALLSGGHALLIGVPGLAKTSLVKALSTVFGLQGNRVQFTPDLMPADILGSEVLEEDAHGSRSFRFIRGPVFCQLLMADEINRASPRTQSALLQAMAEHRVTIAGVAHEVPQPFHVLATQNPLEQEGTYPLPEAQLDRFLMQIDIDYPEREAERQMLLATTGAEQATPKPVFDAASLMNAQAVVRRIPVGESVVNAILTIVRQGRPQTTELDIVRQHVAWGPGPRAAQALMLASRARALLDGRFTPSVEDVVALTPPILRHRMALGYAARAEGITLGAVIERLIATVN